MSYNPREREMINCGRCGCDVDCHDKQNLRLATPGFCWVCGRAACPGFTLSDEAQTKPAGPSTDKPAVLAFTGRGHSHSKHDKIMRAVPIGRRQ